MNVYISEASWGTLFLFPLGAEAISGVTSLTHDAQNEESHQDVRTHFYANRLPAANMQISYVHTHTRAHTRYQRDPWSHWIRWMKVHESDTVALCKACVALWPCRGPSYTSLYIHCPSSGVCLLSHTNYNIYQCFKGHVWIVLCAQKDAVITVRDGQGGRNANINNKR